MLEHALARNHTTGRYTFAIGPDGDVAFDERAVYPVLACLLAKKGEYRWNASFGTEVQQIQNSTNTTASRFAAAGTEAIRQAKDDGWITDGSIDVDRRGAGRWVLLIRYKSPSGAQTAQVNL